MQLVFITVILFIMSSAIAAQRGIYEFVVNVFANSATGKLDYTFGPKIIRTDTTSVKDVRHWRSLLASYVNTIIQRDTYREQSRHTGEISYHLQNKATRFHTVTEHFSFGVVAIHLKYEHSIQSREMLLY